MNLVRALDHHFLFALESSRTVALSAEARAKGQFQAVQTLAFPDEQPLRVYLRSVQEAVLVTRQIFTNKDDSQGTLYLVSSDTDLTQAQLTTIYQRRWKVEEYHKSLKQNASMGKSPTKRPLPKPPISLPPCWPMASSKCSNLSMGWAIFASKPNFMPWA